MKKSIIMDQKILVPSLVELRTYLDGYGWKYRETTSSGSTVLIAPFLLEKISKGILISFRIEGEFVMISTVGLLKDVPIRYSKKLLELNDRIKLVKLYLVNQNTIEKMDIDVGFELWGESWNRETFYAFMDLLGLGIENVLLAVDSENIPHKTSYVHFE